MLCYVKRKYVLVNLFQYICPHISELTFVKSPISFPASEVFFLKHLVIQCATY